MNIQRKVTLGRNTKLSCPLMETTIPELPHVDQSEAF